MTHDELSRKLWILPAHVSELQHGAKAVQALRAVVELHKPIEHCKNPVCTGPVCAGCGSKETLQIAYPCPTIQAIEKELK